MLATARPAAVTGGKLLSRVRLGTVAQVDRAGQGLSSSVGSGAASRSCRAGRGSGTSGNDRGWFVDTFMRTMYARHASTSAIPAWLVTDAHTLRKYGLGMIRPHTSRRSLKRHITSGYLRTGRTLQALAAAAGIEPRGLERTVADSNRAAREGADEHFGRGSSPYGRQFGDPEHAPNANLGPIQTSPFYASAVVPTPLATCSPRPAGTRKLGRVKDSAPCCGRATLTGCGVPAAGGAGSGGEQGAQVDDTVAARGEDFEDPGQGPGIDHFGATV
ncbi:FAD-binding protein [Streptomyces longisporoflavus]|uniref:FAD-binding protein n=1 Tax=Streptomyces longisporoflavus TaxID=28044 RepID=UPI00167EE322|nr:FAD-binding protein [Streptomyces longisporoflavus]